MQDLLRVWYPGFGEVEQIRRMRPAVQQFLAAAIEVDPTFLSEYLLPTLDGLNAEEVIISDLAMAIAEVDMEDSLWGDPTLGEVGDLNDLGKSLKKKLKKVVKKVKQVHEKVKDKIVPSAVSKVVEKAKEKVKEVAKDVGRKVQDVAKDVGRKVQDVSKDAGRSVQDAAKRVGQRVQTAAKKTWVKYGNIILGVVGAVLAPFTGGASLAAAALLTTANQMYQTKRQAQAAKLASKHDAAQLAAQASQEEATVLRQVDDFFNQNREWFAQYGVGPAEWGALTLEQKIELINAGAEGRLPRTPAPPAAPPLPQPRPVPIMAPTATAPVQMPPAAAYAAPSGGGAIPDGSYQPAAAQAAPGGVQTASIFGGGSSMAPLFLIGLAVAVLGKQGGKGGRRARRNPGRRRTCRMRRCA